MQNKQVLGVPTPYKDGDSGGLGKISIFSRKSEMEDSPKLHIITIWLRGICSETFQLFDFNQSFLATLGNVIVLFPFLRNSELPDSKLGIENVENALIIWCSFLDRFALQIFVDGWGAKYCIRQQCPDNQGCISCGILVSGIGARGVSSEHMESMAMFSCSPT